MTSTPKPIAGEGVPVVPAGLRISAFIDYVKLTLRFDKEVQPATVAQHLPDTWNAKRDFFKLNIAAHMPRAVTSASNTCDCYTLTIHEPHKHRVGLEELSCFLHAAEAKLDSAATSIEWGVDIYPSTTFGLDQLAQLGQDMVQSFNIQGIDLRLSTSAAVSRKHGPKVTRDMVSDLMEGWTVYIGEQPNFKDSSNKPRWRECLGFKSYFKTTDRKQVLPPQEHRLRLEFTASGTHCPVDVFELLGNVKSAKKRLARYFYLDVKTQGLLHTIRHAKRARCAELTAADLEQARQKHLSTFDMCLQTEGSTVRTHVPAWHTDRELLLRRSKPKLADTKWCDRITKAFERLAVGL